MYEEINLCDMDYIVVFVLQKAVNEQIHFNVYLVIIAFAARSLMFHVLNDVSHNISSPKLGIYRFSNDNINFSCYSLQPLLLFLDKMYLQL
jgi:hypothetical protein